MIARGVDGNGRDRKSTRLNSSHTVISYAVFCLKKKKTVLKSRDKRTSLRDDCVQQQEFAHRDRLPVALTVSVRVHHYRLDQFTGRALHRCTLDDHYIIVGSDVFFADHIELNGRQVLRVGLPDFPEFLVAILFIYYEIQFSFVYCLILFAVFFFFLNMPPPPKFSPFPLRAPLHI